MNLSALNMTDWSTALAAQPYSADGLMEWVTGPLKDFFPFQRVFMAHCEVVAGQFRITHWQADGHEQAFLDRQTHSFEVKKRGMLDWWLANRKPFFIDLSSTYPSHVTQFEIDEITEYQLGNVAAHGSFNIKGTSGTYFSFSGIPEPLSDWHLDSLRLITPVLNDLYVGQMVAQTTSSQIIDMTLRQKMIVRSVVEGKDDKTIARELDIAVQTVRNQLSRIYQQLNIHKRSELIAALR